jgi:DNA-binding GntR family transcriptional regulator
MHMRRRDVDDLAEIAATMVARKQKDFKDWWSDNYRFLRRLYEISERPHTTRLVVQVLNLVEPYGNIRAHSSEVRLRVQDQRKAMLDALRSTDADLLSSLIADSIEAAQKELLASMGASGAPDDPLKRLRRV